jgi:ABC-type transporter Mla subunit MlaD
VSEGSGKQSAAASAAEKVRAILEAAEQSASELRAEAAEEIDAQLERAQTVAARLSERADQIERSLQGLADSLRDELSAVKADLEELRAMGEGVGEKRAAVAAAAAKAQGAAAEAKAAPAEPESPSAEAQSERPAATAEPESERPPQPPTEPRPEPRPVPPAEPQPEPQPPAAAEPAAAASATPAGDGHEGARVIALNMALNGSPRDETARYLSENFELDDPDALLDEVYARAGG